MPVMNLRNYLHELRKADHMIASLPVGPERTKFQAAISAELDRVLKYLQVESTKKGNSTENMPQDRPFCAEDAEAPPDPWGG